MKQRIVKIVSNVMLLVFLAGVMPKEYIHELFFDHHDTVETSSGKDVLAIHKKHVHCAFLNFEFAPFIAGQPQTIIFKSFPQYADQFFSYYRCAYFSRSVATHLRGPPSC